MDRRKWFRLMGAAGGAVALNPLSQLSFVNESHHPLDDGSNGLARLCYNENPYGPSQQVRDAIVNAFDISHMYPFAYIEELANEIAEHHGVSREHIVLTAGSREGLNSTALTFSETGGNMIAPYPTYQAQMTYARGQGMHVYDVPLKEDFGHDLEAMEKRITNRTSLVFICNPNNPTGNIMSASEVRPFCKAIANRALAFVDEAYIDYVTDPSYSSMLDLVKEDLNVVVSRTFSKIYGLAGIRLGYLVTRPDIAGRIRSNLMAAPSIPAVIAASAALKDKKFYDFSFDQNKKGKEIIYNTLDSLGLEYKKSHTNFIFFKSGRDIVQLNQQMKDKGVLVGRPFPPLPDHCRISTGKLEDVQKFDKALKEVLG